ncbi:MAG: NAD-dependent epimerase/dehydratase family protein [Pelagibacteraceae bacterium]|nr:NAD-dependent epimerase/dehydratase family protein [Pelagibacteraceae bacterium]
MKSIIITGCNGFIGINLARKLLEKNRAIGIDNFVSSDRSKLSEIINNKNFSFIEADINNLPSISGDIEAIYNLACPASPPRYQIDPIFTLKTNFTGTLNLLELARKKSSIFIQASTSEVYGDPLENPQNETYKGNVNTLGPRACYDEGKRVAETLCYEYRSIYNLNTRIVRIFNTYGKYMDPDDGRVISNFLVNVIRQKPLEIYGDGSQTRSFCYIDDLVDALIKVKKIDFDYPINIGNDTEISLNKLIDLMKDRFGNLDIKFLDSLKDDPRIRRPDISKAKRILNWEPKIELDRGIDLTYNYFKKLL